MPTWSIATKDLRQIARDRKTLLFLLLMPIAFTVFFGLAFSGIGAPASGDPVLRVGMVDLDTEDALSRSLIGYVEDSDVLRIEPLPSDRGRRGARRGG